MQFNPLILERLGQKQDLLCNHQHKKRNKVNENENKSKAVCTDVLQSCL